MMTKLIPLTFLISLTFTLAAELFIYLFLLLFIWRHQVKIITWLVSKIVKGHYIMYITISLSCISLRKHKAL